MGYPDGYYYGQGRIICDTSTFSVGDTIRVRSMTDSSKVWNKQVATVGTALVFTVPCYDYYKICTVQTINDTPTEIGGVYRTVDYGQTLFIDVLDKTSLAGIQGILNAHQEEDILNIGDEVNVLINNISTPFLIAGINLYESHEVILASKYASADTVQGISDSYSNSPIKTYMDSYYATFNESEKAYIKDKIVRCGGGNNGSSLNTTTQKVWAPTAFEVESSGGYGVPSLEANYNVRFPLFVTQDGRTKTRPGGTSTGWWTASRSNITNDWYACMINSNGEGSHAKYNSPQSVVPCFRLTADA